VRSGKGNAVPIVIQCPHCRRRFRVPDKYAGKRVKCPKCEGTIAIRAVGELSPEELAAGDKATREEVESHEPTAGRWFLQTEDSQQYGPVSKTELDAWLSEGRIDASCQLLCEGWKQWKWADEVYAELAEAAAEPQQAAPAGEENPFAGIAETAPAKHAIGPFGAMLEDGRTETRAGVQEEIVSGTGGVERADDGAVTPGIRQALAETRPWVRLISILWFILGGLMIVALLIVMAFWGASGLSVALPGVVGVGLGLATAYLLFDYARRINIFLRRNASRELEEALVAQKSLWKFVGIVTLIDLMLAAIALIIVIAAAVGIIAQ
jgi:predicted Zn finger-like uncharacterized protein